MAIAACEMNSENRWRRRVQDIARAAQKPLLNSRTAASAQRGAVAMRITWRISKQGFAGRRRPSH